MIRVWDRRRLIVPISSLLQKPFQNWTRTGSQVIGSVYLYVDWTVELDGLRVEQSRVLTASENWDGDVDVLQVVDTTDRSIVLRSLMTAADSPRLWDPRCEVREALVRWLQKHQPSALPRERMRIHGTLSRRVPGDQSQDAIRDVARSDAGQQGRA